MIKYAEGGKNVDGDFLLIHRMKRGEDDALEVFVRKYYPLILKYCRYHTADDGYAEDLTQETFERFFRSLHTYQHSGKAANYLYVIAGNLCKDRYRKKEELNLEELPEAGESPLEMVDERMDMERALGKLPDELREVIILHYFQELKLKEIAGILNVGLPLVKYRVRKAKELLGIYLKAGCERKD